MVTLFILFLVYTINRDVLDKGRRLENLFWRIWGSERIERTFSGAKVSAIFMMIVEEKGPFEYAEYRIPPRQNAPLRITAPPRPIETLTTPRPSLEIECPPTPPPSPIRPITSVVGFQLGSSYLSKFPSQTAITASLQQAFPDAPPSPPIPPTQLPTTPTIPEGIEVSNIGPSQPPTFKQNVITTIVSKDPPSYSTINSEGEGDSTSSKDGRKKEKVRKTKPERPPRGRRKIVATKAVTARAAATRKIRPNIPRRKSSSSSNTAINTAVSSPSNTLTTDVARSLPSASQRQRQRNSSASGGSESEGVGKKGDAPAGGWVVDPDFRTKYLERTRKEKLVALTSIVPAVVAKTTSTAAIMESVATTSTKVNRGKGKNVLVVDEIVPLKGLTEDALGVKITTGDVPNEEIDELPSNLVRRKSELTLLFEGAKKAEEKSGKGRGTKKVQVIVEGEMRR